jgi:hypothetical protein
MWASVVHVAIISSKLSGGVCVQSEVGSTFTRNYHQGHQFRALISKKSCFPFLDQAFNPTLKQYIQAQLLCWKTDRRKDADC